MSLERWPAFAAEVFSRLEAGRREYGDRSFHLQPDRLLAEIREELLDVAAWSFILASRLEAAREALRAAHDSGTVFPPGVAAPETRNARSEALMPGNWASHKGGE